MLVKQITYTDYDGNTRTEDFYFNLNKAEIAEMELRTEGGMEKLIKKITDSQDRSTMVDIFKTLILQSYGEKSPDGRRFIKSEELRTAFEQTEAFSDLFIELATNADSATAFVNGIMPKVDNPNGNANPKLTAK